MDISFAFLNSQLTQKLGFLNFMPTFLEEFSIICSTVIGF